MVEAHSQVDCLALAAVSGFVDTITQLARNLEEGALGLQMLGGLESRHSGGDGNVNGSGGQSLDISPLWFVKRFRAKAELVGDLALCNQHQVCVYLLA